MIDYTAETGLPMGKKKTRRGGRKGRGPDHHLANLQSAMQSGDHGAAKTHALSLANALHKGTTQLPPAAAPEPEAPEATVTAGPASQPSASGLGKLAAILRAKK